MSEASDWIQAHVCQGLAFPVQYNWVSMCFQDVFLYGFLVLFILVLGAMRLSTTRGKSKIHDIPTSPTFVLKQILIAIILATSAVRLVYHAFYATDIYYFKIAADAGLILAWIGSLVILRSEYKRGLRQNWMLRTWWTLCFVVWSSTLKYLTQLPLSQLEKDLDYYVFFVQFCAVTFLCLLALFFNRVPRLVPGEEEEAEDGMSEKNLTRLLNTPKEKRSLLRGSRKFVMTNDEEFEGEDEVLGGPNRENKAWLPSRLVFWWVNALMSTGFKRPLQQEDMMDLADKDTSEMLSSKVDAIWEDELKKNSKKGPSVWRLLRRLMWKDFVKAGFFKLGNDLCVFIGPFVLSQLITFLADPSLPLWRGCLLAVGLFFGSMIQSICVNQYFHKGFRIGMEGRTALVNKVFEKSFKLSTKARQSSTTGEIVNLQSIDCQKIADLTPFLHMLWSAPLQIAICLVWLVLLLGPTALAGLGAMLCLVPINGLVAKKQASLQKSVMSIKDKRSKLMNEILSGIRVLKFFVWEPAMMGKINVIRGDELTNLKKGAYLRASTIFLWTSTPLLVAIITFAAYTLSGHELTAAKAFTALALFNVLRFPLNMLPMVINSIVEARVSVKRIQTFLMHSELDPKAVEYNKAIQDPAVRVENGTFKWSVAPVSESTSKKSKSKSKSTPQEKQKLLSESKETPVSPPAPDAVTLQGISFDVKKGELLAIVGTVGVGKSSLMAALLGEIEKMEGSVFVSGSIAYVPQQPWIKNATVRDNILFGMKFDRLKYEETVRACELSQDFGVLPDGDMTEIGEKGINLSGGQKQRISTARAVYNRADVYLMDDPLSAVDAHVGRSIFNNCINGVLRGCTRILVTHQLQFLSEVDRVVVLKQNGHGGGTVSEIGTYQQLMDANGEFSKLMNAHVKKEEAASAEEAAAADSAPADRSIADPKLRAGSPDKPSKAGGGPTKSEQPGAPKKLMTAEERKLGRIDASVYVDYVKAMKGGLFFAAFILMLFTLSQGTTVLTNLWLAYWAAHSEDATSRVGFYLGIYAGLGIAAPVIVVIRSLLVAYGGLEAAKTLHQRMLVCVLRSPVSFFDTTPLGRVLNRFTKDISDVDQMVTPVLMQALEISFQVLGTLVVVCLATPWFLVPLVPLAFFYRYIQNYYVKSSRELKRLDSISKSPIFAHFSESLTGVSTIRAYGAVQRFIEENYEKVNQNIKAYYATIIANRWLAVRLEFVGYTVVTFAALLAVLNRGSVEPALAGLAITYSLGLTGLLNFLVRAATDVENQLVSVERVIQYSDLTIEVPSTKASRAPPAEWPQSGQIQMKGLSMRYRPGLPLVLNNISCTFNPREKVGIVGRTGSGKSSLIQAIFRIAEPESGNVEIDGINTSSISLDDLRSRLSIIPQDPVLFTGSIRTNVDPTGSYGDQDIWQALTSVHMREAVELLPEKLDSPVAEFGENFSVGQRQLLCMARALLKKSKIIIMDEATAAVDMETDALIQSTIRKEFGGMTCLTIAHRIHTILDYDRVLVMQAGKVVEFDTPQALIEKNGIFASMVQESKRTGH